MRYIYIKDKFDLVGFVIGETIYDIPRINLINKDCYIYILKSSGLH
jgi:phosphoribosylaminoimidazole (AIR) synthetase